MFKIQFNEVDLYNFKNIIFNPLTIIFCFLLVLIIGINISINTWSNSTLEKYSYDADEIKQKLVSVENDFKNQQGIFSQKSDLNVYEVKNQLANKIKDENIELFDQLKKKFQYTFFSCAIMLIGLALGQITSIIESFANVLNKVFRENILIVDSVTIGVIRICGIILMLITITGLYFLIKDANTILANYNSLASDINNLILFTFTTF